MRWSLPSRCACRAILVSILVLLPRAIASKDDQGSNDEFTKWCERHRKASGTYALFDDNCSNLYVRCLDDGETDLIPCPDDQVFKDDRCVKAPPECYQDRLARKDDTDESTRAPECGKDEVYLECGQKCPRKCSLDSQSYEVSSDCEGCAESGCYCKEGLWRDSDGQCVSQEQCRLDRIVRNGDVFRCPEAYGDHASTVLYCHQSYYRCDNWVRKKLYCPEFQIFDVTTRKCRPLEDLPYCQFDCADKGTHSMHSLGCSPFYWWCWDGRPSKVKCVSTPQRQLYFNPKNNQCDKRESVEACQGREDFIELPVKPMGPRTTAPPTPAALETTTTTIPPHLPRPSHIDCSQLNDGNYPDPDNPCAGYFFQCSNAAGFQVPCSPGLVYDPETDACQRREDAPRCSGKKEAKKPVYTVRRTSNDPIEGGTIVQSFDYQHVEHKYPLNCTGKPDGNYADPKASCAGHFYMCSNGNAVYMPCPPSLYYNAEARECHRWNDVPECANADVPQVATTTTTTASSAIEQKPTEASLGQSLDCSKAPDGNYADPANPCSSSFFTCSNQQRLVRPCPIGLYYDKGSDSCLRRHEVPACGGSRPNKTSESGPAMCPKPDGVFAHPQHRCNRAYIVCKNGQWEPAECKEAGQIFDPARSACADAKQVPGCDTQFCNGKQTGARYSAGGDKCTSNYITCVHGVAVFQACPSPLVFNDQSGNCEYAADVAACGIETSRVEGQVEVVQVQRVQPQPQPQPADLEVRRPQQQTNVDGSCQSLPDGDYEVAPCSKNYRSCSSGIAYQRECPWGLVYDGSLKQCERPADAPTCGNAPVPTQTSAPISQGGSGQGTQRKVNVGGSCQSMPDGDYEVAPCSKSYRSCGNGIAYQRECPPGLVYDGSLKRCERPADAPTCGVNPPSPTLPPAIPQGGSGQGTQQVNVGGFCQSLPNGDYEVAPCSKKYRSCGNGIAYQRECPPGLVYDGSLKRCERPADAPTCGINAPKPTLPPPGESGSASGRRTIIQESVTTNRNQTISHANFASDFCLTVRDGYYPTALCSSDAIYCSQGKGTLTRCGQSLVFDGQAGYCRPKNDVAACNRQSSQDNRGQWIQGQVQQGWQNNNQNQGGQSMNSNWWQFGQRHGGQQDGQRGGQYGQDGQQSWQHFNQNGGARNQYQDEWYQRHFQQGPGGQYAYQFRPDVFELPRPTHPPVQVAFPTLKPESTRQPYNPFLAYQPRSSCAGKPDGLNVATGICSPYYGLCQQGKVKQMQCPDGYIFDRSLSHCQIKAKVQECNQAAPRPTPGAIGPGPGFGPQPRPLPAVTGLCFGKPDGFYPKGDCNKEYTVCHGGKTFQAQCQQPNYVFNPQRRQCDHSSNVISCSQGTPQRPDFPQYRPAPITPAPFGPFPTPRVTPYPTRQPGYFNQWSRFSVQESRAQTEGRYPGQQGSDSRQQGSYPGQHGSDSRQQGSYRGQQGSYPRQQGSYRGQIQGSYPGRNQAASSRQLQSYPVQSQPSYPSQSQYEVDSDGETACSDTNEVYTTCGSACEPSCSNLQPKCNDGCVAGCHCKSGYVRGTANVCVPVGACPSSSSSSFVMVGSEGGSSSCSGPDEVYRECANCQASCTSPEPVCEQPCRAGCGCRDGYFRTDHGRCVPRGSCSLYIKTRFVKTSSQRGSSEDHSCNDGHDHKCKSESGSEERCPLPNEKYSRCKAWCQPTCFDKDNKCNKKHHCTPGCVCMPGYLRSHTGACVKKAECFKVPDPIPKHSSSKSHESSGSHTSSELSSSEEKYKDYCKDKKRGTYKLGECSSKYIYCKFDVAHVFECDDCEVFNGDRCVPCWRRRKCRSECRRKEKCRWDLDHSGWRHHYPIFELQSASHEFIDRHASAMYCSARPDGFYGVAPCRQDYAQCHHGHYHQRKCPQGNIFEEQLSQCVPSNEHHSCGSQPFPQGSPGGEAFHQQSQYVSDRSRYKPIAYGPIGQNLSAFRAPGSGPLSAIYGQYGSIYPKPGQRPVSGLAGGAESGSYGWYQNNVVDQSGSSYNNYEQWQQPGFEQLAPNQGGQEPHPMPAPLPLPLPLPQPQPQPQPQPTPAEIIEQSGGQSRVAIDVAGLCRGLVDGSVVSLGKCKRDYAECSNSLAIPRVCPDLKHIFDDVTRRCIDRNDEPICRILPPAPSPTRPSGELADFCLSRDDGYFSHPSNCTKFLQCHRKYTYTFQCSYGLVFNGKDGVKACDYPRNVPECVDANLGTGIDKECEGRADGAFLRHPSTCQKFRRCVHGRLVDQDCPDGLVFNLQLSVCDYKHAVPECNR